MSLDLRALAYELDELHEDDCADPDRLSALEGLEAELGGSLHVAKNRGHYLMTEEELKNYVREQYDGEIPQSIACHVDWDAVAKDERSDWTIITFDGEDYYTRDVK